MNHTSLCRPLRTGSCRALLPLVAMLLFAACTERGGEGFVRMKEGRMVLHGQHYFPVVMNYQVNLVVHEGRIWAASYNGYNTDNRFRFADPALAADQLRAELKLMRSLGFNAVRVVHFTEGPVPGDDAGRPALKARTVDGTDLLVDMDDPVIRKAYLAAISDFMAIAHATDMRVILLTTIHNDRKGSREHFTMVADHLRNDTNVLAFDLFNEPLYFDLPARRKEDVHSIVRSWRKLATAHAPHHLVTIGLTGIREVHAWDPHLLDVDFISFHPYEYEPDQVLNEIRWYGKHVRTPWMIGETSLPADDDSVSYADMATFARRTLDQVVACGGIGYSWWQFKDVRWGRFHSDFMGLLSMEGELAVGGGPISVLGRTKPAADVFRGFDAMAVRATCEELPNYLNYSEHIFSRITGRLVDERGRPIEGGVVIAWNREYTHSYHTTSQADGTFELKGDMHFHHWMASALDHAMVREALPPSGFRKDANGVFRFHLGELRLRHLNCSVH
jgi:hypothetical protein